MIVIPRNYRCGQCSAVSTHNWGRIMYSFGDGDLDQRSRDVHSPLEVSVQRCPTCGLCARRIDQAKDEFARVAMRSAEYAALLDRNDLPRLAQTYLLASCVERTRGFAGRAAWFALSAAWVCDDAGYERGALDAREIAVARLREARARRIHLTQSIFTVPPRGTTQFVLADTLRKLGRWSDALSALLAMPTLGRDAPPWLVNAVAFERHLIKAQDRGNYDQDDADGWCARELFAKVPPLSAFQRKRAGANDDGRAQAPQAPAPNAPSGVRPVFFLGRFPRFNPRDAFAARWGKNIDSVEYLDPESCSLAQAINAMFPAMHRRWIINHHLGLMTENLPDPQALPFRRSMPPALRFEDLDIGRAYVRRRQLRAERARRRQEIASAALRRVA